MKRELRKSLKVGLNEEHNQIYGNTAVLENPSLIPRLLILAMTALFYVSPISAERIYFNGKDWKDGFYDVPADLAKNEKVWVVADVHGANLLRGDRSTQELVRLLSPEKVIIYIPSFKRGYQFATQPYSEKFISEFKQIQKKHNVHDKMFIHGFSGGSQFVHRFAFYHPSYVIGVSAHSGGSWATGGAYGRISTAARSIPFAISCGDKDLKVIDPRVGLTRFAWYQEFDKQMKENKFVVGSTGWKGFGHRPLFRKYGGLMKECFLLSTAGEVPQSDYWSGDLTQVIQRAKQYRK